LAILKNHLKVNYQIFKFVRKSIVAKTKIKKGDVLNENNITTKRPGKV
jgi:sialic acid synthase SpsE